MRVFFPLIFSMIAILLAGLVEIGLLFLLNRPWWAKKTIRTASWSLPLFGMAMVLLWGVGEYYTKDWLAYPGAILAVVTFVSEVALMVSLPLSGAIHFFHWLVDKFTHPDETRDTSPKNAERRAVLKAVAAGLPVATLSMGVFGVGRAFGLAAVDLKPITFSSLPQGLRGLRILHLTDAHLRHWVTLDHLEAVLTDAEPLSPDLVVVTGDLADEIGLLGNALAMINALGPRLGVYACLGNHEYFRGIHRARDTFERSPVRLLVNEGTTIAAGGHTVFLAGIDDPRSISGVSGSFFTQCVDAAFAESTPHDFSLLLSHRPDAFSYAAQVGVDLTLSGHTHGGQIGIRGRSLFEPLWPENYLWGHYRKNDRHLYTSSGVGHWFPFRLGCPPEAPVIELRAAHPSDQA